MSDFYEQCKLFAKHHKPRTVFEKSYAEVLEFEDKKVWGFPSSASIRDMPAIPREIRISKGIEPSIAELDRLIAIVKKTKSSFGYSSIFSIVYFFGEDITRQMIWLVKNQMATLNVDRWGNAVYFQLLIHNLKR